MARSAQAQVAPREAFMPNGARPCLRYAVHYLEVHCVGELVLGASVLRHQMTRAKPWPFSFSCGIRALPVAACSTLRCKSIQRRRHRDWVCRIDRSSHANLRQAIFARVGGIVPRRWSAVLSSGTRRLPLRTVILSVPPTASTY